ncbi:hypothetical protein [Bradyrhizobium jicamae]|uniref:hypothetical protein n=1 Tax=Bradyrhizobium jicamae TaxID=280332 RepID=UPI001BAD21D7|nr:hypothetical protein [Bradyrhizobium jicamae]MBR0934155.1 hypothetical protein [Bradyrhizobium jicamae]
MRRLMKFLHTMGAIGLIGSMACLVVLIAFTSEAPSINNQALLRVAMGGITTWIFLPSLGLTLVAGLLAIAVNRAFHSAGWAWAKLATGILTFEWGFTAVLGPMQEQAELGARLLAGQVDAVSLAEPLGADRNSLFVLIAVATVNVVLGVWRPRFTNLPD